MAPATLDYLTLPDTTGIEPAWTRSPEGVEIPNELAGAPQPLNNIGVGIPVPVMVDGEVMTSIARVHILPSPTPVDTDAPKVDEHGRLLAARIIPGTRIVESGHPETTNVLLAEGLVPCDPPKSERPRNRPKNPTSEEA